MSNNTEEAEITRAIREVWTQFNSQKVSNQRTQWSVDPSRDLNRQRQIWRSNESLFDSTLFSNDPGKATIGLTATATDNARVKSAFVGRYISHSMSVPGVSVGVDPTNVQIDSSDEVSLDHGLIQFGPFFHDGTDITDGFGFEIDSNGMRFRAVKGGSNVGDTPVSQGEWNVNRVNSPSNTLDMGNLQLMNFPYGFYNALPLAGGRVRSRKEEKQRRSRIEIMHSEDVQQEPLLSKPHLPIQVFVSNDGVAETLGVSVGGMQYSRFGQNEPEFRTTSDYRQTTGGEWTATEPGAPDPENEPGDAFFAYRRQSGREDLTIRDRQLTIDPTADIFIYFWDEWDPATALDGTFNPPDGSETVGGTQTDDAESLIETNKTCTTYTPTIANFRGLRRADAGSTNEIDPTSEDINDRVPQEATRVWSLAIRDQSADVDIDYLEAEVEEAY